MNQNRWWWIIFIIVRLAGRHDFIIWGEGGANPDNINIKACLSLRVFTFFTGAIIKVFWLKVQYENFCITRSCLTTVKNDEADSSHVVNLKKILQRFCNDFRQFFSDFRRFFSDFRGFCGVFRRFCLYNRKQLLRNDFSAIFYYFATILQRFCIHSSYKVLDETTPGYCLYILATSSMSYRHTTSITPIITNSHQVQEKT